MLTKHTLIDINSKEKVWTMSFTQNNHYIAFQKSRNLPGKRKQTLRNPRRFRHWGVAFLRNFFFYFSHLPVLKNAEEKWALFTVICQCLQFLDIVKTENAVSRCRLVFLALGQSKIIWIHFLKGVRILMHLHKTFNTLFSQTDIWLTYEMAILINVGVCVIAF